MSRRKGSRLLRAGKDHEYFSDGIAEEILTIYGNYRSDKVLTASAKVEQHARRASELDPTLAEPYAALSLELHLRRRYFEARKAMQQALQLDPDDVTANFWQGTQLISTGYVREGNAALDRTLELDPLLPNALLWRGIQHVFAGELVQSERLMRQAAEFGIVFVGWLTGALSATSAAATSSAWLGCIRFDWETTGTES